MNTFAIILLFLKTSPSSALSVQVGKCASFASKCFGLIFSLLLSLGAGASETCLRDSTAPIDGITILSKSFHAQIWIDGVYCGKDTPSVIERPKPGASASVILKKTEFEHPRERTGAFMMESRPVEIDHVSQERIDITLVKIKPKSARSTGNQKGRHEKSK